MSGRINALCFGGLLALFLLLTKLVAADNVYRRTTFEFTAPVEIPGRVLSPGKYVFQLANTSDLNVVQVFSEDLNGNDTLIDTILAIPDYITVAPDTPVINFEERQSGRPASVYNWFYPGDSWGWKFQYPKDKE